ncbi:ATP-binding protein [Candidatus Poriferisodalis sp.]|uniref:ATP-binding protein n=1 Tax=Candidatus Poriferisodalis sp. TaxID=3101277 RepID=UPI003D0EF285
MPIAVNDYLPRVVDGEVSRALRSMPAVVLEGPRGCGKTRTGREHACSEVLFGGDAGARIGAQLDPHGVLSGSEPRLLDEWQLAPEIWNQMRVAADDGGRPGRFILTGSASPADDVTRHTGAGRVRRVRMRTMSSYETGLSSGEISMDDLFGAATGFIESQAPQLGDIIEAACRGGWPASIRFDLDAALDYANGYLMEISRADVPQLGTRRSPTGLSRLLRSLARNVSTEASQRTLAKGTGAEELLDPRTVGAYLEALEQVFVVEDIPAWSAQLRSRARLRQAPKRHLADPSLAVAALDATPQRLRADLETFGLLFEALAIRDLRVYAQRSRGWLSHYRDSDDLEVDAIIERPSGAWLAAEIKLGGEHAIEQAARSLTALAAKVSERSVGRPADLVVLTAVGSGYRRPDGVAVVPVTALGP